ncbi:hypothetical protein K437DRAFT_272547 [Tilletiaria anomala UBC 951]|uniref:Uncharacterized protein n=1 Tax=Tilletiaria anomala (strain ATCC 24038 / CBS 436.72 / UBC 951) TaxID=1037660 RepID=A0A066WF30_TILAU|nr:uncharacterized protein K437DRAFT_272547 [Tilletiaria anomala UBC 951]KDN52341.1 hypothetical protein K437DRAFT_272547 [Tilletiaria anomala UBC 951]
MQAATTLSKRLALSSQLGAGTSARAQRRTTNTSASLIAIAAAARRYRPSSFMMPTSKGPASASASASTAATSLLNLRPKPVHSITAPVSAHRITHAPSFSALVSRANNTVAGHDSLTQTRHRQNPLRRGGAVAASGQSRSQASAAGAVCAAVVAAAITTELQW